MRALLIVLALLLPAVAVADSKAHWERWTDRAWFRTGHPAGRMIPPKVDTAGGRQCRGDILRQVTVTRYARQRQCVLTVDYAYWCRPRDGAELDHVPADKAPSCGPTRATSCKGSL